MSQGAVESFNFIGLTTFLADGVVTFATSTLAGRFATPLAGDAWTASVAFRAADGTRAFAAYRAAFDLAPALGLIADGVTGTFELSAELVAVRAVGSRASSTPT